MSYKWEYPNENLIRTNIFIKIHLDDSFAIFSWKKTLKARALSETTLFWSRTALLMKIIGDKDSTRNYAGRMCHTGKLNYSRVHAHWKMKAFWINYWTVLLIIKHNEPFESYHIFECLYEQWKGSVDLKNEFLKFTKVLLCEQFIYFFHTYRWAL